MDEIIEGIMVALAFVVFLLINIAMYALIIYGVLWFLGILIGADVIDLIINFLSR